MASASFRPSLPRVCVCRAGQMSSLDDTDHPRKPDDRLEACLLGAVPVDAAWRMMGRTATSVPTPRIHDMSHLRLALIQWPPRQGQPKVAKLSEVASNTLAAYTLHKEPASHRNRVLVWKSPWRKTVRGGSMAMVCVGCTPGHPDPLHQSLGLFPTLQVHVSLCIRKGNGHSFFPATRLPTLGNDTPVKRRTDRLQTT